MSCTGDSISPACSKQKNPVNSPIAKEGIKRLKELKRPSLFQGVGGESIGVTKRNYGNVSETLSGEDDGSLLGGYRDSVRFSRACQSTATHSAKKLEMDRISISSGTPPREVPNVSSVLPLVIVKK